MAKTSGAAHRPSTHTARSTNNGQTTRTQRGLMPPTDRSSTSGSTRMSHSSSRGSHAESFTTYSSGNGDANNHGANNNQNVQFAPAVAQYEHPNGPGVYTAQTNLVNHAGQWAENELGYPENLDDEENLVDYNAQLQPSHNGQQAQYNGNYENLSPAMVQYLQQQAYEEALRVYYHQQQQQRR